MTDWPSSKRARDLAGAVFPISEAMILQLARQHGVGRKAGRCIAFSIDDVQRLYGFNIGDEADVKVDDLAAARGCSYPRLVDTNMGLRVCRGQPRPAIDADAQCDLRA